MDNTSTCTHFQSCQKFTCAEKETKSHTQCKHLVAKNRHKQSPLAHKSIFPLIRSHFFWEKKLLTHFEKSKFSEPQFTKVWNFSNHFYSETLFGGLHDPGKVNKPPFTCICIHKILAWVRNSQKVEMISPFPVDIQTQNGYLTLYPNTCASTTLCGLHFQGVTRDTGLWHLWTIFVHIKCSKMPISENEQKGHILELFCFETFHQGPCKCKIALMFAFMITLGSLPSGVNKQPKNRNDTFQLLSWLKSVLFVGTQ